MEVFCSCLRSFMSRYWKCAERGSQACVGLLRKRLKQSFVLLSASYRFVISWEKTGSTQHQTYNDTLPSLTNCGTYCTSSVLAGRVGILWYSLAKLHLANESLLAVEGFAVDGWVPAVTFFLFCIFYEKVATVRRRNRRRQTVPKSSYTSKLQRAATTVA